MGQSFRDSYTVGSFTHLIHAFFYAYTLVTNEASGDGNSRDMQRGNSSTPNQDKRASKLCDA